MGLARPVPVPGDVAEGSGRRIVLRELILSPRKVEVWEWCRRRSEELNGVSLEVCLIAVYMAPWGFSTEYKKISKHFLKNPDEITAINFFHGIKPLI